MTNITEQKKVDEIVLGFLQNTVQSLEAVSIQNLTGHFSQLPADIRKKFNSTKAEVKKFLLSYPDVFIVKDEIVTISKKKDLQNFVDTSVQCSLPTMINNRNEDSTDERAEKRQNLIEGKGRLCRIFDKYGFIECTSPGISGRVYFDVSCFEDRQSENLNKLKVDDEVYFIAKPCIGHKAQYRAKKVWRPGYFMPLQGSEQCYSSSTSLASQDSYQSEKLNGVGKVVKITANYGFIRPSGNEQGNVFFFRTKVQLPNTEEVKNLEDVLKEGDILYFSAIPSRKKNADAPWEAVKVSINPLESAWNGSSKHCNKSIVMRRGSTSSTDCSYHSLGLDVDEINDEKHIYNEIGTIHNLAGNKPEIHFGKNEIAIIPSNVVYKNKKLVEEFGWEMDEGEKVKFNAEYDGTDWRAVLVWIGDKPQLSSKKSHKKRTTPQVKQSTISDLCEISLYDDQSDDGIWHMPAPHIDTDDENGENWPALKPPISAKIRQTEKIKLLKPENNLEAFRNERINRISNDYDEKCNSEATISSYATKLRDGCADVINSKKNVSNTSYATDVTAVSKECQQNENNFGCGKENLQRYKMNNGWEEESFNTKSEKWPALSEPLALPIPNISNSSFRRSKEKLSGFVNENQSAIQQQTPNMLNYNHFISHKNDMQENYYSDSDEFHDQEIASDMACIKDGCVTNSQSSTKVSTAVKEVSYEKFSNVRGTVVNIGKHSAFIKSEKLHQNVFFCWEQAFFNGRLVSRHYSELGEAFNEFDSISFTYCQMVDESGKEWISVLQVWKGNKPKETTVEVNRNSENCYLKQTEIQAFTDKPVTCTNFKETAGIDVLAKNNININSLATTSNAAVNKDSGVCIEELETCEYKDSKTTSGLSSWSSLPALLFQNRKGGEAANQSTINNSLISQLNLNDNSSRIEKNLKGNVVSFLNHLHGLSHSSKPTSVNAKESLPHILSASSQASIRSQETQTEIVTSDEGIQTFITGTVLSIEVFPH